ncbi:MAG: hypothetical protein R2693_06685 [Nocardioidaceae bacterium]
MLRHACRYCGRRLEDHAVATNPEMLSPELAIADLSSAMSESDSASAGA